MTHSSLGTGNFRARQHQPLWGAPKYDANAALGPAILRQTPSDISYLRPMMEDACRHQHAGRALSVSHNERRLIKMGKPLCALHDAE